jgi:release factor glutamine methyltransferase
MFYGLEFETTPDVLRPYSETESLVAAAIAKQPVTFCDVGTGSGNIAVSVLANLPNASGIGLDIWTNALPVAQGNAETHGVSDRLTLVKSDVFTGLSTPKFDLITCNPPYWTDAQVDALIVDYHEFGPRIALTCGGDGLAVTRAVILGAPAHLNPGGFVLIEFGDAQLSPIREMIDPAVWLEPQFVEDQLGSLRVLQLELKS